MTYAILFTAIYLLIGVILGILYLRNHEVEKGKNPTRVFIIITFCWVLGFMFALKHWDEKDDILKKGEAKNQKMVQ